MGLLLFLHIFLSWQNFLIFSTWSISATFLFFFLYKIALFLNYFLLFTQLFAALVDVASLSSSLFAISAWDRSFYSNISAAFSFSFMRFACSWIIFSCSLSLLISASASSSLLKSLHEPAVSLSDFLQPPRLPWFPFLFILSAMIALELVSSSRSTFSLL